MGIARACAANGYRNAEILALPGVSKFKGAGEMNRLTRILTILFVLFVLAGNAQNACADTFDMTWSGLYGTGSAVVTATSEGGGQFLLSSVVGTQAGLSLTLLPPGAYGSNGNFIYPGLNPQLDFLGIAFTDGSFDYNIFFDTAPGTLVYRECISSDTACENHGDGVELESFVITRPTSGVPEPSSALLLVAGMFGLVGVARRRRAL